MKEHRYIFFAMRLAVRHSISPRLHEAGSNTLHIFTMNPSPLTVVVDEFLFGFVVCFVLFC